MDGSSAKFKRPAGYARSIEPIQPVGGNLVVWGSIARPKLLGTENRVTKTISLPLPPPHQPPSDPTERETERERERQRERGKFYFPRFVV